MVRAAKKGEASGEPNPEAIERKRLKGLAISNGILSETPAKCHVHLNPSKTVIKHHGKDILRKSQRKNRYLFSFPGLIAPIGGGKIGELKDLGTKNPILYLDFPQVYSSFCLTHSLGSDTYTHTHTLFYGLQVTIGYE